MEGMIKVMYQILENPRMMSSDEIDKTFRGKWVYVVKADITRHGELIEGMPVVIADFHFEGVEEGIYKIYKTPEYGRRLSLSSLMRSYNDLSLIFPEGDI